MIVDTSAMVAILAHEPTRNAMLDAIASAGEAAMSAATLVELHAVVSRRDNGELARRTDRLIRALDITIAPFDQQQAGIAARAYREYGRGSGHPAGLNLGDCYAYALATHRDQPLLFIGDDFTHTDVRRAVATNLG